MNILMVSCNVKPLIAYTLNCTPLKMEKFQLKHVGLVGYFIKGI
jgi:hypothetical protein